MSANNVFLTTIVPSSFAINNDEGQKFSVAEVILFCYKNYSAAAVVEQEAVFSIGGSAVVRAGFVLIPVVDCCVLRWLIVVC